MIDYFYCKNDVFFCMLMEKLESVLIRYLKVKKAASITKSKNLSLNNVNSNAETKNDNAQKVARRKEDEDDAGRKSS